MLNGSGAKQAVRGSGARAARTSGGSYHDVTMGWQFGFRYNLGGKRAVKREDLRGSQFSTITSRTNYDSDTNTLLARCSRTHSLHL